VQFLGYDVAGAARPASRRLWRAEPARSIALFGPSS